MEKKPLITFRIRSLNIFFVTILRPSPSHYESWTHQAISKRKEHAKSKSSEDWTSNDSKYAKSSLKILIEKIFFVFFQTSRTPGRYLTRNTIPYPMMPKTTARTLVITVCFSSESLMLHPEAMKSLRQTAAREFNPELTVLRAPLKTPATNRPKKSW